MARSACNAVALVMLHVVNIHLFSSKINMQDGDLKVIIVTYGIKMSNMLRCKGYLLIFILWFIEIRILQVRSNFVYTFLIFIRHYCFLYFRILETLVFLAIQIQEKEKGYHPISTCLELALYLYKKLCSYRNGSSPRKSKG